LVWSMIREPRTIRPGEKSVFTIEMEESGRGIADVEISFEIDPKDAGSMEAEKVKTDPKGHATGTFVASSKIEKDVDILVKAKWKMGGQDKENTMMVEVRPKPQ
jgi:hypothetical protein